MLLTGSLEITLKWARKHLRCSTKSVVDHVLFRCGECLVREQETDCRHPQDGRVFKDAVPQGGLLCQFGTETRTI